MRKLSLILLSLILAPMLHAQDQLDLPGDVCVWFVNEDGSCVQCSISMCGVNQNVPQASTLLFKTEYGNAVRGGSGPGRVEAYAESRGIPCYNVTGDNTWDWMKWAARNGRTCAIGCFSSHFQTLLWYDPTPGAAKPWKVRNNWYNTTDKTAEYTEAEFRRYHLASGQWVVILKTPPPPMTPTYVKWW